MQRYKSYQENKPQNSFPFWNMSQTIGIDVKTEPNLKKKVLIVDDNQFFRRMAEHHLQDIYECNLAIDGEDALKKHANFNSDLILMDIQMPKLTGIEAATEIRKHGSKVPIIAVTATPTSEIYNTMNACIVKPYKKTDLIKAVEAAFSKQSLLRQMNLIFQNQSLARFETETLNSEVLPIARV